MASPVFILAAGMGTRLRPLTAHLSKPLLPVGDRRALEHVLERVRPVARCIVTNAHHRAADLRAFVLASARDVVLSEEAQLLGTAGGLANAAPLLGPGSVLVWNGDILASLDASALVNAHDSDATLAIREAGAAEGNVGVDIGGRIVRLRRETTGPGEVRAGWFLGIHVVGERLRERLPREGCLVGDVYLPALREGRMLRAFDVGDIGWHDIGTLRDYEAANVAWLKQSAGVGGSYVDPSATVSQSVTLRACIVGRGARVEGNGVVERCIVWPGARLTAPLSSAVVTTDGDVVLLRG